MKYEWLFYWWFMSELLVFYFTNKYFQGIRPSKSVNWMSELMEVIDPNALANANDINTNPYDCPTVCPKKFTLAHIFLIVHDRTLTVGVLVASLFNWHLAVTLINLKVNLLLSAEPQVSEIQVARPGFETPFRKYKTKGKLWIFDNI